MPRKLYFSVRRRGTHRGSRVEFRLSARLYTYPRFIQRAAAAGCGLLPMLRVTVMMFRDMVESVMLLNDEDCR